MYIDVKIPYDEEGWLAMAYNRALGIGDSEWVLFLDHDVFLCNPLWYTMCLEAIENLKSDPKAACVSCVCGGEHRARNKEINPSDRIEEHIQISKDYYKQFGNKLQRRHKHATGFFMLLKRDVALKIGFKQINKTINNIDKNFGDRLIEADYHIYLMPGLYVYHRRGMKHLKKEFKTND